MSIEAMKQALEALYLFATDESPEGYEAISAITALRTAIEQAEKQEPVAWDDLLGAVARGWGHSKNAHKEMDSDLALAIAEEVKSLLKEKNT